MTAFQYFKWAKNLLCNTNNGLYNTIKYPSVQVSNFLCYIMYLLNASITETSLKKCSSLVKIPNKNDVT